MRVDSVTSPQPGLVTMSKTDPFNFTKSSANDGLTWTQSSRVQGPFVEVTYRVVREAGTPRE